MTTVQDIYNLLNEKAPFSLQESWDNSGLLAGDPAAEVHRVLLSLDITDAVIDEAAALGAELIVSHHPVIFRPISRATLCAGDLNGCKVWNLARYGIAAICAHTNLDSVEGGVNSAFAGALGLRDCAVLEVSGEGPQGLPSGLGRYGTLPEAMGLNDFLQRIRDALGPAALRYTPGKSPIRRVAVGGGACGELLERAAELGCDAFVTADLKYNRFLDAAELGITLVDAGHFPTENPVMDVVERWLGEAFPALELRRSQVHHEVICSFEGKK